VLAVVLRFVNGTGAGVWTDIVAPFPSGINASLAIWVTELQKIFPQYKYGENLFIMAYGECGWVRELHFTSHREVQSGEEKGPTSHCTVQMQQPVWAALAVVHQRQTRCVASVTCMTVAVP
jgi:hypothetical protein